MGEEVVYGYRMQKCRSMMKNNITTFSFLNWKVRKSQAITLCIEIWICGSLSVILGTFLFYNISLEDLFL